MTAPLFFAVLIAVIAEFLVGYNTSLMNAPEAVVFPGHTTAEWSLAVSAFAVGGPGGAILGGILANKKGRRGALLIDAFIFLFGGLMLCFAPSIYWLIPARFVIGIASGFASVLVPIYLGELAPPTLRGTLGTLTQFSMVIGILASDVLAYPLATPRYHTSPLSYPIKRGGPQTCTPSISQTCTPETGCACSSSSRHALPHPLVPLHAPPNPMPLFFLFLSFSPCRGWRVLFSVTAVLTVAQLLCSPFLLESPRWLLARDEKSTAARVIMKKLRGFRDAKEVEMEVRSTASTLPPSLPLCNPRLTWPDATQKLSSVHVSLPHHPPLPSPPPFPVGGPPPVCLPSRQDPPPECPLGLGPARPL